MVAQYEVTAHATIQDMPVLVTWHPEHFKLEAELAARFLERLIADPEISREDAVFRACNAAELALQEFRDRGWIVPLPGPDEARELMRNKD